MSPDQKAVEELLSRNVEEVIVKEELKEKLLSGKKLRLYIGVDPSSPVIHLGHAVGLRKMRQFQEMGHKVIFLIGDFTGMIGDPTDKNAQRVPLTEQQVKENAKTYFDQAKKILDMDNKQNPVEVRYNSEWHNGMTFKDVVLLSANFTVQQMLERDMFQTRLKDQKPIGLHEFLYPLMQGFDSVAMDVDLELGGTDQTFNMLAGRTLMKVKKDKTKQVMTLKLLLGTDGRKMSKSYGNVIGVTDGPEDMFGKVMSLKDDLIIHYFELATDRTLDEIKEMEARLKKGENPRDIKFELALEIVEMYHGEVGAKKAAAEFDKVFKNKEQPTDMPVFHYSNNQKLVDLLVESGVVASKSEARRLIQQGAVSDNDKVISDIDFQITDGSHIYKVGKRRFLKAIPK